MKAPALMNAVTPHALPRHIENRSSEVHKGPTDRFGYLLRLL